MEKTNMEICALVIEELHNMFDFDVYMNTNKRTYAEWAVDELLEKNIFVEPSEADYKYIIEEFHKQISNEVPDITRIERLQDEHDFAD